MTPHPPRIELVIEGSADSAHYKEAVALLDRSGLAYRIASGPAPGGSAAPRLRCGDDILTDISKDKVAAFLWAHGARFEDS
jgi:hypothetical protein